MEAPVQDFAVKGIANLLFEMRQEFGISETAAASVAMAALYWVRRTIRPVTLKDIEREIIEAALEATAGNRTRAAEQLGMSLRTLQYRLKSYRPS